MRSASGQRSSAIDPELVLRDRLFECLTLLKAALPLLGSCSNVGFDRNSVSLRVAGILKATL